jgi:hypothetical protein
MLEVGGDVKSCLTGAMPSNACSAGATHNRSSMVASTTCLTRALWISEDGPVI